MFLTKPLGTDPQSTVAGALREQYSSPLWATCFVLFSLGLGVALFGYLVVLKQGLIQPRLDSNFPRSQG